MKEWEAASAARMVAFAALEAAVEAGQADLTDIVAELLLRNEQYQKAARAFCKQERPTRECVCCDCCDEAEASN